MQRILLLIASCLLLTVAACSDDEPATPLPQQLPVNYANIAGQWQLISFNNHALEQGTYVRLELKRRERTFVLADNLQSMYGQQRTGKYQLTFDDDSETTILSGLYDNGVGAWAHEYTVASLTDTELQLVTTDKPHETTVYRRASSE